MTGAGGLVPVIVSAKASGIRLPASARTRSGVEFAPRLSKWIYTDGVTTMHLDFEKIQFPPNLMPVFKRVLLWYAESRSPAHLQNLFSRFLHFTSTIKISPSGIDSPHLMNYFSSLPRRNKWYLTSLRGPIKRWFEMGFPGVSRGAYEFLCDVRLKGNRKGEAILTMAPLTGRFTEAERQGIVSALECGADKLELEEVVLIYLFLAIGPRPIQYAALKICDFTISETPDGLNSYCLAVPRAKQREKTARSSFTSRLLTKEIGERVERLQSTIAARFTGILDDVSQAPLFPLVRQAHNRPLGFEFHRTAKQISGVFKHAVSKLNVYSERTGEPLNISPIRCRRTIGCIAAEEGHGLLVIAGLLDQTDTQNTGVYIEASPAILERIDKVMAFRLAPLAQAFNGTLISDESKATRAGDSTSRIADPRFDAPVGNCGQYGYCGALAPLSCYTCRAFQPWLDGPHEAILDFLIVEREKLVRDTDNRIAAINDRTILAVAAVVILCAQIKKGNQVPQKDDR